MIVINKEIQTCEILGVKIAELDMETLVDFTNDNLRNISGQYMCVANVHTTVMSYEDEEYKQIQNESILTIPDGGPLSTVANRRGYKKMKRTTGPSYMEEIFRVSVENGYRHYFYGSTEETLEKMKQKLKIKYPEISIEGMYSPPFRLLTDKEDEEITVNINEANADFIWVGLGAPKQEKWMAQHKEKVNGLMVGVGAGFDYFAENITRAPMWMQKSNLEWLYRLMQEPRRLFKRYWVTNTKFIWNAVVRGR